ncbi:hypothetical protein C8R44DRAFT_749678 [Mycena epipterygia]|nr:hypothetical protein C8R44DRAFT_749678 [Mycena epipterygia]
MWLLRRDDLRRAVVSLRVLILQVHLVPELDVVRAARVGVRAVVRLDVLPDVHDRRARRVRQGLPVGRAALRFGDSASRAERLFRLDSRAGGFGGISACWNEGGARGLQGVDTADGDLESKLIEVSRER